MKCDGGKSILTVISFLQVSSDLSIMDLDLPFILTYAVGGTINCYSNLTVLAVVTWQVLIVSIPMIYIAIRLQVRNILFFESYCNSEMISMF